MCNAGINLLWLLPIAVIAARVPNHGPELLVLAWSPLVVMVVSLRRKYADIHDGSIA